MLLLTEIILIYNRLWASSSPKLLSQHTNLTTTDTQLIKSKGLLGYIAGKIVKPGPESIPLPSETGTVQPISTPTLDEWIFRDQLTRGHITLNCSDVVGLGVVTTGTAKEAWDSIQTEWGRAPICDDCMLKKLSIEWSTLKEQRYRTILSCC